MRRIRSTPFDLFARTEVRQLERALIGEYRGMVLRALEHLSLRTHDVVAQIAALPDLVRGYESIKLRNAVLFREQARALESSLRQLAAQLPVSVG